MEAIQDIYDLLAKSGLSLTGLLVLTIVFALAFLFSMREATTWFFKIDDIKKDLRQLHDAVSELESGIRTLETRIAQAKNEQPLLNLRPQVKESAANAKIESAAGRAPHFRIHH